MRLSLPAGRSVVLVLVAALFATGCSKIDPRAKPPELLPSPSVAATPGVPGAVITDWRVGDDGGDITSSDKSVSVHIDKGAADDDTTVRLTSTPALDTALTGASLAPVSTVTVTATTGALRHGRVSVKYDAAALDAAGSKPELLMTLIQDDGGHWSALDTTIDPATSTATAEWPHFSKGFVGGLKSAGKWFVDHVATYGLGPVKEANCEKKDEGWRKDGGWTALRTNGDGGSMKFPPLDGCASTTDDNGRHRLEVTNRYWYAFRSPMPKGASQSMEDILEYSDLGDVMLGGFTHLTSGDVLIPGHSRARLSVKTKPAGQSLVFQAERDRISFILAMVATVGDIASWGEARVARASLKAALKSLDARRAATGTPTVADIAVITDLPWGEKVIADAAGPGGNLDTARSVYEHVSDGMDMLNCARDVGKEFFDDKHPDWESSTKFVVAIADKCRKQVGRYLLGAAFKSALDAAQGKMAEEAVKGLLDAKSVLATLQGSVVGWAKLVGQDYANARLTLTQARDPRYDPLEGYNWAGWMRGRLSCDPGLLSSDGVVADVRLRTDLTGDGAPEWVVSGQCPASTGSWPTVVEVVDGTSTAAGGPRPLGTVSADLFWASTPPVAVTTTTVKGKAALQLSGKVFGPTAIRCCPDLKVTLKVQWRNGRLTEVGRQTVRIL